MNVSSQNIPKIDSFSTTQLVKYVAHFGPIIKVIHINTPKYPNHICSISSDQRLKLWTLNNPYTCLKTLNLEFMICDIIQGNNDCVLVSGEKIVNIDLNTQKIIYIIQPKIGHFIEFSKISKVNEQYGISSSLNKFYLIFDINNGKIKKRIKMNQVHYICWMEKNLREKKEKMEKENEENIKKGIKEEEEEDDNEITVLLCPFKSITLSLSILIILIILSNPPLIIELGKLFELIDIIEVTYPLCPSLVSKQIALPISLISIFFFFVFFLCFCIFISFSFSNFLL